MEIRIREVGRMEFFMGKGLMSLPIKKTPKQFKSMLVHIRKGSSMGRGDILMLKGKCSKGYGRTEKEKERVKFMIRTKYMSGLGIMTSL